MRNQSVRLFLYSSLAIVVLTLVWGIRQIPRQGAMADDQLRTGLQQELILLTSAVRSSTTALKFRLLDVLKSEGNDHPTRAWQDSVFVGAALLEWDSSQWKVLWRASKLKEGFGADNLRGWMKEWPLAKIAADEAYFARVGDFDGQPHFAILVPVRRPNNTPMLGVGIFPANEFGLTFSAEHSREARVFDNKGFALALSRPAYLGTSLKREPIVADILEGDAVTLQQDWKSEHGAEMLGLAARMSDSNLFVALQSSTSLPFVALLKAWLYLLLSAAGALAINWFLFTSLVRPLLKDLEDREAVVEGLRRQLAEAPMGEQAATKPALGQGEVAIPSAALPQVDFSAPPAAQVQPPKTPKTALSKVVAAALRNLETRLREQNIEVVRVQLEKIDFDGDFLQMQTAIEEILKNSIEALMDSVERRIVIASHVVNGRVRLSIEDTGCGVPSDNIKKVFDPFFSTKDSQGVARGLGLNVVRRVVEELNGHVQLRDRTEGAGTVVELEWPAPFDDRTEVELAAEPVVTDFPVEKNVSDRKTPRDLDFLGDQDEPNEEFTAMPSRFIRKPKVRTLD